MSAQCEQVWREAILKCPQDAALWRALIAAVVLFFKMRMGWKKEEVGSTHDFSLREKNWRRTGTVLAKNKMLGKHTQGKDLPVTYLPFEEEQPWISTRIENKKLGLITILVAQGSQ